MKITVTSVLVDDQAKALAFYTDVLGFVKKTDIPAGGARWLTVVSPERPTASSSCSSPMAIRPRRRSRRRWSPTASPTPRSPWTTSRPSSIGSARSASSSRSRPTSMGPVTTAVFDDTCGNLIQIAAMQA